MEKYGVNDNTTYRLVGLVFIFCMCCGGLSCPEGSSLVMQLNVCIYIAEHEDICLLLLSNHSCLSLRLCFRADAVHADGVQQSQESPLLIV